MKFRRTKTSQKSWVNNILLLDLLFLDDLEVINFNSYVFLYPWAKIHFDFE